MPMQATTTTPLFAAQMTPHRSLGARGGWVVVGLTALLATLPGLVFLSLGAWPIIGFIGLDVLAIAIALYVSLRQGKRREQITVWADQLEWMATDAKGGKTLRRFNPKTVRLLLDRDADEKTLALRLRQGKDELEVGGFLSPDDKSSFAKALGTALRKARAA
jgi:uncharacterized membrane protein